MSALLAALRISRRDALRARGRSALIMLMIGLPVLVITGFLTFLETADINPREGLTAGLGTRRRPDPGQPGAGEGGAGHQRPDVGRSTACTRLSPGPGRRPRWESSSGQRFVFSR